MTKPELDIFTGDKDLGLIYKEQNNINVKFIDVSVPFLNTAARFSINTTKTRILILQGMHDGEGFNGTTPNQKLGDFVYEMEEWVNANREQRVAVFTDSLENNYTVDAVDWQWTRVKEDPNRIAYNLIMKQRATY